MPFFEIEAKADTDHAEILIYDEIGDSWWNPDAVAAKRFVRELNKLDVSTISLRINSPGGSVFDGHAIYNALKNHKATITTYVDGLAASIASVVALAADRVVVAKNSMFMIHNPHTIALGDAAEMRKTADFLDQVRNTIVGVYEEKTGQKPADIEAEMDREAWYEADEAVALGYADAIEGDAQVAALARFDVKALKRFHHTPVELVAALAKPTAADATTTMRTNSDLDRERQIRDLQTRKPLH